MKYCYIRVSSLDQAKFGQSIEAQTELLKPLVDKMFIDSGKSAKLDNDHADFSYVNDRYRIELNLNNRPEFKRLIQTLKEGDEVYFKSWDRISRSQWLLEAFVMDCEKKGVKLIPVRDTNDDLTRMILGVIAQNEIKTLSKRIKETTMLKFNKNVHTNKDSLGYRRNKRNRETGKLIYPDLEENLLVIVPTEAEIVKNIFNLALSKTPQEIADTFPNKPFSHRQTIANILKNDIYIGMIHLGKESKKGIHTPIISEELFKKVNKN